MLKLLEIFLKLMENFSKVMEFVLHHCTIAPFSTFNVTEEVATGEKELLLIYIYYIYIIIYI
jgi:hypothetical protein